MLSEISSVLIYLPANVTVQRPITVSITKEKTKQTQTAETCNNNNNNNISIIYYLWAESTATRPITDKAQCSYR
jgi:hypothetical protein